MKIWRSQCFPQDDTNNMPAVLSEHPFIPDQLAVPQLQMRCNVFSNYDTHFYHNSCICLLWLAIIKGIEAGELKVVTVEQNGISAEKHNRR